MTLAALRSSLAPNPALSSFFMLARSIAVGQGVPRAALNYAQAHRANSDVTDVLKAAVSAGSMESATWAGALSQYQNLVESFQASLRSWSAFDALLPSMARVPLRTKVIIMSTGPTASRVNEMGVKPLSEGAFTLSDPIEPWKTSCIIALTNEMVRLTDSQLFNDQLSMAVAEASDSVFLQGLVDATTPTGSAGSTADNVLTDLGTLVDAVTTGSNSRLFFIVESANCKKLVLKRTTGGSPLFPGLTIGGGPLGGGITCVVSDQLPSGYAVMVDAQGIAAGVGTGAEGILLDSSRETSLQFSTTPDSPVVAGSIQRSLFQEGLTALRSERYFGFAVLRTSAVAALSGVSY